MTVTPPLAPVAGEVLESLYQHRVLTARQLHAMHAPHSHLRWMQQVLATLSAHQLVSFATSGRGGRRLYRLSAGGATAVEQAPGRLEQRRRLITPAHAVAPLDAHTLAVNDVGIAFMQAARPRGDDCAALAWRHEIAHPTRAGSGRSRGELLIADALLTYLARQPDGNLAVYYRFIELDRASVPTEALATKLARYATLFRYTPKGQDRPGWRAHYPVFPGVLCVLTGRPKAALERRRQTVLALCADDQLLTATTGVEISLCLLQDLRDHGPFAAVCQRPDMPARPVDWLGAPA